MGYHASSRDVVRLLEESLADSLITARQNGYAVVKLQIEADSVVAIGVQ
ncbi:hypothetical protein [Moraxella caprae]|nr:hypothetical protein [Moraxella caprae]